MKVRFLKTPVGRFGLAYFVGEIGDCPDHLVDRAIKEGYIQLLPEPASAGVFTPAIQESINPKVATAQKAIRRPKKKF